MTGRGIDQVLPHPCDPQLHEPYVRNAKRYVQIAEQANGPIPAPVDFSYIWGDSLEVLAQMAPDVRLINLETSVTCSGDYWKGKGIHYRMSQENIACLIAARIDCCSLANNHVLDWGYSGLTETLETLDKAGIKHAGAGSSIEEAEMPAVMEIPGKGRLILYSCGLENSGIPPEWAATATRPGVNLLSDLSDRTVRRIAEKIRGVKEKTDIVVVSIHWGENWGYEISGQQREFARMLIDGADADIIHGHSSHHVKGIALYRQKPIFYGCGDLINDYEGIHGYESFRGDLSLMYFPDMDPATGRLESLKMFPATMKRFALTRPPEPDARWLEQVLNREGDGKTRVEMDPDNVLALLYSPVNLEQLQRLA